MTTSEVPRPQVTNVIPRAEQNRAARLAGGLYLAQMALGVFGESFVRGSLIAPGDPTQTARNIVESEQLFRVGIATDLLTYASVILLTWALYVLLRPVHQNLALLGAFFRVAENALLCAVTMNSAVVLLLLTDADFLRAFDAGHVHALARLFIRAQGAGMNVGFLLLGLGSAVFAWLLLKSRYVPRVLAGWGVFASLLLSLTSFSVILFPAVRAIQLPLMIPMGLYEVGLGAWLLVKGVDISQ